MPKVRDLEALEAHIIREEQRCEETQLQLRKLEEEEITLQQRLSAEIPTEKARLYTKMCKQRADIKNKKSKAYELLRAQLDAGASKPPVQPAHGQKRERSLSDPDFIFPDPDSDIEEVEAPKEAEPPVNVKREPSPIRVWDHNWPEHERPSKKARVEETAEEPRRVNATPGPSSSRVFVAVSSPAMGLSSTAPLISSTPTVMIRPGAARQAGSQADIASAYSSGPERPVDDIVIHKIKWHETVRGQIKKAIRGYKDKVKSQLPSTPDLGRQINRITPLWPGDPIGHVVAVRVLVSGSGLTNLLVRDGIEVDRKHYIVSSYISKHKTKSHSGATVSAAALSSGARSS